MATQEHLDYADGPTDGPLWGRTLPTFAERCFVYGIAWGFLAAWVFLLPLLGDGPLFHRVLVKFHEKGTLTPLQDVAYIAHDWNAKCGGVPALLTIIGLGFIAERLWRRWHRLWWCLFVVGAGFVAWWFCTVLLCVRFPQHLSN